LIYKYYFLRLRKYNSTTFNPSFIFMRAYIIQAVVGAVVGFLGNHIPLIKNNQSTVTNVVLGLVGSVGGNAAASAAGIGDPASMVSNIGTGAVGSIVGLLAGKLFGNKAA
jgi:uncharacterized membrane protein YeaQ/YmgE (transglycosylase-associated protein family)